MDTQSLLRWLMSALHWETAFSCRAELFRRPNLPGTVRAVQDFEAAGICSSAEGVVLTMANGEEYQLSVVQTAYARQIIDDPSCARSRGPEL